MSRFTRRHFVTAVAALAVAGCAAPQITNPFAANTAQIDQRVGHTMSTLYQEFPNLRQLESKASGALVMPLMTEAGFGLGGSYGRGALVIDGDIQDYYVATSATFGFQIGAQQYGHVLYFMTDEALNNFRNSAGWSAGGDIEYAIRDMGGNLRMDTNTALAPVFAVIFGQAGLKVGATLEGSKYTRIQGQ